MSKYKVVGPHAVCGHTPGSVVDVADLAGGDVAHLVNAGHVAPVVESKKATAKVVDVENLSEGDEQ